MFVDEWQRKWLIVNYILVIFVGVAVTWWQTMRVRVHALPEQEIERLAGMEGKPQLKLRMLREADGLVEPVGPYEYGVLVRVDGDMGTGQVASVKLTGRRMVEVVVPEGTSPSVVLARTEEFLQQLMAGITTAPLQSSSIRLDFTLDATGGGDFVAFERAVRRRMGPVVALIRASGAVVRVFIKQRVYGDREGEEESRWCEAHERVLHFIYRKGARAGELVLRGDTVLVTGGSEEDGARQFRRGFFRLFQIPEGTGVGVDAFLWGNRVYWRGATRTLLQDHVVKVLRRRAEAGLQVTGPMAREVEGVLGDVKAGAEARAHGRAQRVAYGPELQRGVYYFPDEHVLAICIPVFMPLFLPVLVGVVQLLRERRVMVGNECGVK